MFQARCWLPTAVMLTACCATTAAWAALAVPGNYQNVAGFGNDWTPEDAPLMNDLGGGLWDLPLSGLTANTRFNFKILDDGGSPPAVWGDPEVPDNGPGSPDNWFLTDASGDATIMLDRNIYSDGFLPAQDRIVVSTDFTEFSTFFATGDWMEAAGAAGNWNPGDPMFAMSDQGGGLWALDAIISTPGSYMFKATAGDWPWQWGTNGRLNDSANWSFDTTFPNQPVQFFLDISKGAISVTVIPEPASLSLAGIAVLALIAVRRRK